MSLLDGLHHYTRLAESVTFPIKNFCRQSRFGCAITPSGVSWRHVPTHTNPADCASRGPPIFSRHMLYDGQVLHGCIILPNPDRTRALRYSPMFLSNNVQNLQYMPCMLRLISDLASRYSSWPKLLLTTAYLYFF